MSRTETISLHQLPSTGLDENGRAAAADARQAEASRKRAFVLLGASISQLPIWGFAMSYGVLQEYYMSHWALSGSRDVTGIIGTTQNGVLYLSMPFLFAAFTRRYARQRQLAATAGALIAAASFVLSSFSAHVWHLVATQGVLAALGCALMFSPMTLSLGEWFAQAQSRGGGKNSRAIAYGVTLSCKNIVGSFMPFVARALLERYGFRVALRVWAIVALGTGLISIALVPTHPTSIIVVDSETENGAHSSSISSSSPESCTNGQTADTPAAAAAAAARRRKNIPWHFLHHRTFYIYSVAIVLQSAGYGIPQTYLPTYAREVTHLSQTSATLLLTVFNVPGILASTMFGYLSDNRYIRLSASTVTAIPPLASALAAFLLWGLTSRGSLALLLLFSITFGFFAGGYSATWGGVINELENEAARCNEAIDPGMLYGLLNGARGIGYVSGGLVSVPLLKSGINTAIGGFGYSSTYGPLILFTGLSSVFGSWGLVWRWTSKIRRLL